MATTVVGSFLCYSAGAFFLCGNADKARYVASFEWRTGHGFSVSNGGAVVFGRTRNCGCVRNFTSGTEDSSPGGGWRVHAVKKERKKGQKQSRVSSPPVVVDASSVPVPSVEPKLVACRNADSESSRTDDKDAETSHQILSVSDIVTDDVAVEDSSIADFNEAGEVIESDMVKLDKDEMASVPGKVGGSSSQVDIGKVLAEVRRESDSERSYDPAISTDLWMGVAEETKLIEWPSLPKVFGTTGVVVGVIVGASLVLLTVNAILAELSDNIFHSTSLQEFARTYFKGSVNF